MEQIEATSDPAPLKRVKTVSTIMDSAISIPGTDRSFGLDPLLGFIPVSGDIVAAAINLYIVLEGVLLGLPKETVAKMLLWVGLDVAVGAVPIIGPVFDAFLKVNERNARTIESHVERTATAADNPF